MSSLQLTQLLKNLFSFLLAYLGTHTTVWQGDVYYNNNDMPNTESATRCLIGIKGSGEYIILNICLSIYVQLKSSRNKCQWYIGWFYNTNQIFLTKITITLTNIITLPTQKKRLRNCKEFHTRENMDVVWYGFGGKWESNTFCGLHVILYSKYHKVALH